MDARLCSNGRRLAPPPQFDQSAISNNSVVMPSAEALLADKWPSKYNSAGHVTWQGRLYGKGIVELFFQRSRIYHGVWGSAPFQSVYAAQPRLLAVNDAYAGVVLLADICGLLDRARGIVDSAAVVEPAAGCWSAAHANPSGSRRRSSALSSGASLKASPFCLAVPGRLVSSRPARCSAARASTARTGALELEEHCPGRSAADHPFHLERGVGCDRDRVFLNSTRFSRNPARQ